MNIIVCVSKSWGIGNNGDLLFHIKEDMKFFKEKTINNVVVMGRKTLESLPGGKPLKDRVNIVMTRNKTFSCDGAIVVNSINELLEELKKYNCEIFVMGGGEIYDILLPYCNKAYVTKVDEDKPADTYFLNLDNSSEWKQEADSELLGDKLKYKFIVYNRI